MNLLSRYVEAVKRYLPAASREDTGRELKSLLEENLGALAENEGSPLSDEEIADFLHNYGHPYKVARGYFRKRNLISEQAYPLYRRVLATMLSVLLVVDVMIALGRLGQDDGTSAMRVIGLFLNDVFGTLLFGFVLVTAGFHYYGERIANAAILWRWDPRKLPDIGERWANIGLRATFYAIVVHVLYLALLIASYHAHSDAGNVVRLNATAIAWLPWLTTLAVTSLGLHLINLFQRYWTRFKLFLAAAIDIVSGLIALRLLFVGDLLQVGLKIAGVANDATAAQWMGWWPGIYIKLVLIAIVARLAYRTSIYLRRFASDRVPPL